jgi:protease-4
LTTDKKIKGILVRIDSPGGAVAPSQEMYQALQAAAAKKPVAVSMGSTAASGGYYIALGGTKIFANPGSVTGSIGVITQLINVSRIVEKVDVDINTITTGPYKDSGSPFRELSEEDDRYFRQLINDIYEQFVDDVAKARKLDAAEVRKVADGRVFTGRQAKDLKLVDELGSFNDALEWLAKEAKIEGEPKLAYAPEETGLLSELLKDGVRGAVSEAKAQSTPVIEYRYVGPQ